ncbi:hypothetical protein BU047_00520 [Staphylococcus simulans]|uniref:hypothetical protein n=1 Tax=Staphylococcus simulans TaxID=1286 RepID=UPI000D1D9FB5|nr:hypothetical protein [Staphylococcus simulans]PTJ04112.1 hypothetical protein BU047_00520 [Staphylococcus simulans]
MPMKLSKKKSLLHVSTLALSGLLFFNMPGVMNAAESHDYANEQSAELSALVENTDTAQTTETFIPTSHPTDVAQAADVEPDPSLAENVSKTNVADAEGNRKEADTESTTSKATAVQTYAHQASATTSKSEDAGSHYQGETASYADLPETGHVDHPESGAVIAIIMSIVVSTIALIHVCRQNARSVVPNRDDV